MSRSKIPTIQCTDLKATTASLATVGATTAVITTLAATTASIGTAVIPILSTGKTTTIPTTFTAAGVPGQALFANSGQAFAYFCVLSNSWYRVALSQSNFA
jgi:hypothetical protein